MIAHCSTTSATTAGTLDFVDITGQVQAVVTESGVRHGLVTVFSLEDSSSIVVNERESGLISDLRDAIRRAGNGNGRRPLVGSASAVLPAVDGTLRLGAWQRVMLVELSEPGERRVLVQVVGE